MRPIRAGYKRKLQMSARSCWYFTAVFEEELAGQPDEAAAVVRAVARLGEPAALTRELQQSVPWLDRVEGERQSVRVVEHAAVVGHLVCPAELIAIRLAVSTVTVLRLGEPEGRAAVARAMVPATFGRLAMLFLYFQPLLVFWSWSYLMFSGAFNGMYRQNRSWRRAAAVWLAQVGLLAAPG